jgi:hypothetical protein
VRDLNPYPYFEKGKWDKKMSFVTIRNVAPKPKKVLFESA